MAHISLRRVAAARRLHAQRICLSCQCKGRVHIFLRFFLYTFCSPFSHQTRYTQRNGIFSKFLELMPYVVDHGDEEDEEKEGNRFSFLLSTLPQSHRSPSWFATQTILLLARLIMINRTAKKPGRFVTKSSHLYLLPLFDRLLESDEHCNRKDPIRPTSRDASVKIWPRKIL